MIYYTRFILGMVTIYWFTVNRPSTIRPYIVLLDAVFVSSYVSRKFYTSSPSVFLCAFVSPFTELTSVEYFRLSECDLLFFGQFDKVSAFLRTKYDRIWQHLHPTLDK